MSDLQRIFDTDPLDLTSADLTAVVTAYRQQRAQFNLGVKVTKPKAAKADKEAVNQIDLDDLLGS